MNKIGKSNIMLTISAAVGALGFIAVGAGHTQIGGVLIGLGSIGVALS